MVRANRIFIALLALFFCAAEIRIGRAARQDQQPGKPASQTSNNQSLGNQSPGNQSPAGPPEQKPGGQYVKHDGQWHKVKVNVKPPKGWPTLKALHKEGYYAGASGAIK
jgi:hypothetical protein